MWSKEESVKSTVIESYTRLFLNETRPEVVASSLVQLTVGCNLGELTSLEELVCVMMSKDYITPGIIKALWAMFVMKGNATAEQSVRAVIVLGMVRIKFYFC